MSNNLIPLAKEVKLYYSGFHAIAREIDEQWECTVTNSADPIDFKVKTESELFDTLKERLEDYREYCKAYGRYSLKVN